MKLIELLNNLKQQALEQNKNGIKEVIDAGLISHERIFPIINKIDRIWNTHSELQFCELVKLIVLDCKNDLEFTKKLDEYIDENSIK